MTITISRLTEDDIPGAVSVIQEAFREDPYNLWIYNDRSKVNYSHISVFNFFGIFLSIVQAL